jgi:hypothetical protein
VSVRKTRVGLSLSMLAKTGMVGLRQRKAHIMYRLYWHGVKKIERSWALACSLFFPLAPRTHVPTYPRTRGERVGVRGVFGVEGAPLTLSLCRRGDRGDQSQNMRLPRECKRSGRVFGRGGWCWGRAQPRLVCRGGLSGGHGLSDPLTAACGLSGKLSRDSHRASRRWSATMNVAVVVIE